jgi:hypothetical protein
MGEHENINDTYGFQQTAASAGGDASDEDDQAPSGMLNVYKEDKNAAQEEQVDEEITTDDIKFKAQEDQSLEKGEKPMIQEIGSSLNEKPQPLAEK